MAASTITGFTNEQESLLFITERVASSVSLLGCAFVVFTFLWSERFRKPVNRLILYATVGNVLMNIGTLISVDGMLAGVNGPLCQFQAFMIQAFLPADAFWNLSMAINTYLTVFKRYTPSQCKSMEKYYCAVNYGAFIVIAFVYCFVSNYHLVRMYGSATLWCWISLEWDRVRLATCYVPAWFAILASFMIYVVSGRELFRRRRQFSNSRAVDAVPDAVENPFTSFKTTEVQITSELASPRQFDTSSTHSQMELRQVRLQQQYLGGGQKDYDEYSITIERGLGAPARSATHMNEDEIKLRNTIMASNRAAWAYTKCCVLFFVSLTITWTPSSLFRAYTLVHPATSNFGIAYAAGLVLPLMGFWNALIYITISWDAVLDMFAGDIDRRVWRQWHGQWPGMKRSPKEWTGNNGDGWVGRGRRLSLNSKEAQPEERYGA